MSTLFHSQKDGVTDGMNASMEQYLRAFVNHQQNDWVKWLPLAKFSVNNGTSESTKCTPCFAVHDVNPRMSFVGEPTMEQNQRPLNADQIQVVMQQVRRHLRVEMGRSQAIQPEGANRELVAASNIQERLCLWFVAQHIRITRPRPTLDWKWFSHFKALWQISAYAYEFKYPASIRMHWVKSVLLLVPVADNPFMGHQVDLPPLVEADGEKEYQVSSVEDSRIYWSQLQCLIGWTGYDSLTWKPETFMDGLQSVWECHQRYPQQPGPLENVLQDLEPRRRILSWFSIIGRYLGEVAHMRTGCRRNCVSERWTRWETWRNWQNGGSIILYDKKVSWGVATLNDVAWSYW